jgi:ADP-ribosylglycohydrolase
MALGILEVLAQRGTIDQYHLAEVFAARYRRDVYRGYGAGAHILLQAIHDGTPWRNASYAAFEGAGSMGNGAAMRVAPLGAYFADDTEAVLLQADRSAEVTHAHHEGRAGAVAVAVAAAEVWRGSRSRVAGRLLEVVRDHTPPGQVHDGLSAALALPEGTSPEQAARVLGNGSKVTAPDTVPFCLWVADRYRDDYQAALWALVAAGGDIDTTCAIVGGVVALAASATIPQDWLANREPLDQEGGRSPR